MSDYEPTASDLEPTDSDDDYDENERILLQEYRKQNEDKESEEEVLSIGSGSDDNNDFDEDIENYEDDLPNTKAWGQRKRNYYDTDYVDQDFGGFQGKDAEDADNEEQEARAIQERLLQELDENDYMLDFTETSPSKEEKVEEKIKSDVTGLSKRDKLAFFAKESPEFAGLVEDFKEKMSESEKRLQPIVSLIEEGKIPNSPICKYIKTKYHLILNYCTNILYYMLLKARRVPVQSHPVIQRLFQYRQLLKQLESVGTNVLLEVDIILEKIERGEEMKFEDTGIRPRKKVKVVSEADEDVNAEEVKDDIKDTDYKSLNKMDIEQGSTEEIEEDAENSRRAITYQIAKNKGLTPHRKKELRNPRVKYRLKYKKAIIRRKGQVRTPRTELQKYGGEKSGINLNVSKSIKLQ